MSEDSQEGYEPFVLTQSSEIRRTQENSTERHELGDKDYDYRNFHFGGVRRHMLPCPSDFFFGEEVWTLASTEEQARWPRLSADKRAEMVLRLTRDHSSTPHSPPKRVEAPTTARERSVTPEDKGKGIARPIPVTPDTKGKGKATPDSEKKEIFPRPDGFPPEAWE